MEDLLSVEIMGFADMEGITDPQPKICVECGQPIEHSTVNYSIEDGSIHKNCYKPSNLIPLIPIGCESIGAWRKPQI